MNAVRASVVYMGDSDSVVHWPVTELKALVFGFQNKELG